MRKEGKSQHFPDKLCVLQLLLKSYSRLAISVYVGGYVLLRYSADTKIQGFGDVDSESSKILSWLTSGRVAVMGSDTWGRLNSEY